MLPAQPNQSLIDGLACLQALAEADGAAASIEIARLLGLESTRANRLLKTLAALGFARQNAQRKYVAGPAMHVLAAQSMRGSRLLACAMPVIRELREEGLTVALGVLWRAHVCYLYHAKPGRQLVEGVFPAELYPALQSSIGIALLAQKTNREIAAILPEGTGREKLDAAARRSLAETRKKGYALLRPRLETASLGVALGESIQAGLAFAGNFHRRSIPALVRRLRQAANRIEGRLEDIH